MSDLATEVLREADVHFQCVAARPGSTAGLRLWGTSRGGEYDDLRERYVKFSSETFIQAYLEPEYQPGCGVSSHSGDCLCDIVLPDSPVPLLEAPRDFVGVRTADELLEVAANLWLNLDLIPSDKRPDDRLTERLIERVESGELTQMLEEIRAGCTLAHARQYEPSLRRETFSLIKKAFGARWRPDRVFPKELVRELALARTPTEEIRSIILERTGVSYTASSIVKFRQKEGLPAPRFKAPRSRRGMPPVDKGLVWRLHNEGYSNREIARQVDCSPSRVGRIINEVAAKLVEDEGSI